MTALQGEDDSLRTKRYKSAGFTAARAMARVAVVACCATAFAQAPPAGGDAPRPGFVRLNLQGNIKLQALIDLVSKRLDVQLLYTDEIAERQINVRAPREIPVEALPELLGSILRMENLALVDADVAGWKRIVDVSKITNLAPAGTAKEVFRDQGAAAPVTQVFLIKHVSAAQLVTVLRPFLTQPGSSVIAVGETNAIIVTDYAPAVLTVEKLIDFIDRPRAEAVYEFYEVKNADATGLAEQVRNMLGAGEGAAPKPRAGPDAGTVELFEEPRTNQIVVLGTPDLVEIAMRLLGRLDVSLGLRTQVYRFQYVPAERIDRIIKGFLPVKDQERVYESTLDEDGNLLVVRSTPEVHERIAELRRQLDVPVKVEESPIRFYKLKNAEATDVLFTLLALQEVAGPAGVFGGTAVAPTAADPNMPAAANEQALNININPAQPGFNQLQPFNPYTPGAVPFAPQPYFPNQPLPLPLTPYENPTGTFQGLQQSRLNNYANVYGPQLAAGGVATLPGGARVSADVATNSIVIVAPTEVQELYARLIESLDVRRPQVLIEAKVVAINTSDNFSIGVEYSLGDGLGDTKLFKFTSFGLSQVDPSTGSLQIIPALGFNGTLVDPDVADVVVQALAAHSRARVLAAPRVLVNDNSTAQLESVTSVPFQSVNASQTVSTTSLGGNQQAGTIITVTPHISEEEHLQLEFSLEFSTFGSGGTATLPPPRQIDRVGSTVTIPNGQTVIVGGLKRMSETETQTGVPYVEKIPVLRELTSLVTDDKTTTSFFVFIRPIILRDDKFADLRYLSETSTQGAGIRGAHPTSLPVIME